MKNKNNKHLPTVLPGNNEKLIPADSIRKNLFAFIQKERPDLSDSSFISEPDLKDFRRRYLQKLIEEENGHLDLVEKQVIDAISEQATIAEDLSDDDAPQTFAQRLADRVAEFGGSWTFIILFGLAMLIWIVINSVIIADHPFDPYPYVLLNLVLGCISALQAPVIMMSQNRQAAKDRQRSEYDYKVNLKAELEIRLLHDKLDHIMVHQTKRILELQQMQIDMLEDVSKGRKK